MEDALAEYERVQDVHLLPMYELTIGLAHLVSSAARDSSVAQCSTEQSTGSEPVFRNPRTDRADSGVLCTRKCGSDC